MYKNVHYFFLQNFRFISVTPRQVKLLVGNDYTFFLSTDWNTSNFKRNNLIPTQSWAPLYTKAYAYYLRFGYNSNLKAKYFSVVLIETFCHITSSCLLYSLGYSWWFAFAILLQKTDVVLFFWRAFRSEPDESWNLKTLLVPLRCPMSSSCKCCILNKDIVVCWNLLTVFWGQWNWLILA